MDLQVRPEEVSELKGEDSVGEDLTAVAASSKITAPSVPSEDKGEEATEGDKPVRFGKIADAHELGCCEFCGGPVKRRRVHSALKRFCSKDCSRTSMKNAKVYLVESHILKKCILDGQILH